ncbi:MAG: CBS domain-containing protein [Streptosporangiaceae bacterium]
MGTTVRDVMTSRVIAVKRTVDFKQIARVLRQFRVSACPVVNDAGRVVGVVSGADLLHKAAGCDLPAGLIRLRWKLGEESKITAVTAAQLMTAPAVTIDPGAPVQVAARVMRDRLLKRLPVVGADGGLIGIVSRVDLLAVYDRPDAGILSEVTNVVGEFALDPADVVVGVSSGVVTISGLVGLHETALDLVARIRHIEGVVAVRDRLTAGQPTG